MDGAATDERRLAAKSQFSPGACPCRGAFMMDMNVDLHSRWIGGTHVENLGSGRDPPGPKATLFFAPTQVKKRRANWGHAEFNRHLVAA